MTEYRYITPDMDEVDAALNVYAREGWEVHTFSRCKGCPRVDILLIRHTVSGNEIGG